MTESFLFNTQTKKLFKTRVIFFLKNQTIRLINPQIIKTHVHKFTSNHGEYYRTLCILEIRYRLIPPRESNLVNPSISSKPR